MSKTYSLEQIENFWAEQAKNIPWFKEWQKTLQWQKPYAKWFVGGTTNASYACLDQHVKTERKNKIAILWENEKGEKVQYRYLQTEPDLYWESKDRSGRLDPIEEPDLTKLFNKVLKKNTTEKKEKK